MKRFSTLLIVCAMAFSAAQACIKKSAPPVFSPVTVIVMDTTQALLQGAQVKIGKQTFTTSFDGRVVLKPEQISGAKSLTVSCEGFKDQSVSINSSVLIVRLAGKVSKRPKDEIFYSYGPTRGAKGEVLYKTMAVGATADMAVMEEAAVAYDAAIEKPYRPSVPNNVNAGKLTAGEVNDFAKWGLWSNILDNSHKQYIAEWKLTPRQRYTVQVLNKDGYPIPNYPVNLTDKKGNTVFQTVTDNTGKAELWNGLVGQSVEVDQPAWQTIVVDDPCDHSDDVDVVFVFDATGSMGDELRYLQAEMKDVIARAKDATGGLNIRTGAVVYRDHGDEYITRISRLTEDIKTTQAFIDKQSANGGGDYPEAVPEALMAALNSSGWDADARARVTFIILDAPCHQDSATLALLHEQILNAAAQGIRIVPVVCSGIGESGELLLRSIALATNGTSFFLTDDSGIGHTHLKPTTDSLKVEHLNDMLVRTIVEFSLMPPCESSELNTQDTEEIESFIPNPFDEQDLEADPSIPHGEGVHYLMDVSGKLLGVYHGDIDQLPINNHQLPIGVYFIKTFIDGQWYTKKVLVR